MATLRRCGIYSRPGAIREGINPSPATKRPWILVIAAIAGLVGYAASAFAQAGPAGIVAGVPARFPPHYQLDRRTSLPAGFAVDVMDEVARRGGLEVRYRVYPDWQAVLTAMKSGEIDVIPNLGVTPERAAFIDFTVPYETFNIAVFVRATTLDIKSADDLTGRPVAVVADNVGQALMEKRGGTLLQVHQTQELAFMALLAAEADALVYPEPVVRKIAREIGIEERIRQVGSPLAEVKRAIGVRKGQPALLAKLDAGVRAFTATAAFQEIYTKWYGAPEPYWTIRRTALGFAVLLLAAVAVLVLWRYRSIAQLNKRLRQALGERERAEAATREAGELFALFMRNSPMYAYIKEVTPTESRVLHARENFVQMIGLRGSEMAGKTMAELFPAEFAVKITADDWAVASSGRVLNLEEELNGRVYDTIKFPLVRGGKTLLAGYTIDITERKRVEEALMKSEQRYRALFENMLHGFAYCRMIFQDGRPQDFIYLAVNSAFERLTGLKNVVGRMVSEVIPGIRESHPVLFETYGRVALTGQPEQFEIDFKPLGLWLSISAFSAEKEYFVALFDDITERKKTELELAKHREHLEGLVRERTAELTVKIAEIERMNRLFVGRELAMVELKKRIKELEHDAGRPGT